MGALGETSTLPKAGVELTTAAGNVGVDEVLVVVLTGEPADEPAADVDADVDPEVLDIAGTVASESAVPDALTIDEFSVVLSAYDKESSALL